MSLTLPKHELKVLCNRPFHCPKYAQVVRAVIRPHHYSPVEHPLGKSKECVSLVDEGVRDAYFQALYSDA